MNTFALWITRLALHTLFLSVSVMILVPLYLRFESFFERYEALQIILAILVFAWFLFLMHLSELMATRMVFEHQTFMAALRFSIGEMRAAAVSLPLIGRWMVPKPDPPDGHTNKPIE